MGRLGKQLQREFVKSPGKSAVLGLITLVAIWYWAPLIRDWLPGGTAEASGSPLIIPQTNGATAPRTGTEPTEGQPSKYSWRTLVQWLNKDPLTRPAVLSENDRDPFQRQTKSTAEELLNALLDEQDRQTDPSGASSAGTLGGAPIELATLRLVLGGTIVGKRGRSATINGNTYREGELIPLRLDGGTNKDGGRSEEVIAIVLKEVHPRFVVIEWQGQQRRLELERAGLAAGDRIARTSQASQ